MKTIQAILKTCTFFILCITVFISCFKDTVTEHYTFYRPLYKTKDAVFNNIKSGTAEPIVSTGKIFLKDNYVFLNDVNRGVHIIDYTNPNNPKKVAFIAIPGNVDMAVRGNILYVDCYTALVALDITNPLNVLLTKVLNGVFPHRIYSNFQPDTSLIITDWIRVDTTVKNISFLNGNKNLGVADSRIFAMAGGIAPSIISNGTGGSMARFGLLNSRLYTVSNTDIKVFNTIVPANPIYVSTVTAGVNDIETIYPFNNNLFLGSSTGLHIFNVSNPDLPTKTSLFTHARRCDPVIAEQDYAYVTLKGGGICGGNTNQLDVVNIRNLSAPFLIKSYNLSSPNGLGKDGNTLLICDGAAGLKLFNAADPNNIYSIKTITGFDTYDVINNNGFAIVVAKDGLYCVDYANPSNATIISKISINF